MAKEELEKYTEANCKGFGVIQAKKSEYYVMGTREELKDITVGINMASLNTWKYHSDFRIELLTVGK